jgi:hypothetical protein
MFADLVTLFSFNCSLNVDKKQVATKLKYIKQFYYLIIVSNTDLNHLYTPP